jgi:hypothetical protein
MAPAAPPRVSADTRRVVRSARGVHTREVGVRLEQGSGCWRRQDCQQRERRVKATLPAVCATPRQPPDPGLSLRAV